MDLKIVALPSGYCPRVREAALCMGRGWDEYVHLPMMMFLVLGGEHPVLVDSGTPEADFVQEHHGYRFFREDDEDPVRVLAGAGVDPEEIRTVIWTHLHWDHCSNSALFPNATFYVQEAELRYAINPLEFHKKAFQRGRNVNPDWIPVLNRLKVIRGAVPVLPGISTVPLPGHTPGSQGVLIETNVGRYLVAGDCIDAYRNWEGDDEARHIPNWSYTDLLAFDESFRRIDTLDCLVIPSHDPKVLQIGSFG